MKRFLVGLACLAVSGLVFGGNAGAEHKHIEASMLVTGTLVVTTDGSVESYALDKQDKLPPEVVDLLHKAVPAWHFKPVVVDGIPVAARSNMTVRIVAHQTDDGNYQIKVAGAHFDGDHKPGDVVTGKTRKPPKYPQDLVHAGAGGTVYLVIHIRADGSVIEAAAEQVNLTFLFTESQQEAWRKQLTDACLAVVKDWTFNPPTSGVRAKDQSWVIRFPVTFQLVPDTKTAKRDDYGLWETYVRGPKEPVAWLDKSLQSSDNGSSDGTDAVADDQITMDGSGPTLQTPIDHS